MRLQEEAALQLSWQPELADYADAFRARNRARHAWLKVGVIAGVALVVGIVLSITGAAPSVMPLCYLAAALFPLTVVIVQPLSVRSFWRQNPALHAALGADIDPVEGISVTGRSSGTYPWSSVHSFLETDRLFVVQLSGYRRLAFFLLAKRGLPPDRHVDELRGLLSAGIAGSASV